MRDDEPIGGFVLVGGKSCRMGQDKSLMEFGGKPLARRAADVLARFVDQVSLLGPKERYGQLVLAVIEDKWPGEGPLGAICTALLAAPSGWSIVLACDLPLVSERFIQLLVQRVRATNADAVMPRTADGWQPLAAAYHARCRSVFQRAFEAGERSIIRAFATIEVQAITVEEMAAVGLIGSELANVNTPEDWARITQNEKG